MESQTGMLSSIQSGTVFIRIFNHVGVTDSVSSTFT